MTNSPLADFLRSRRAGIRPEEAGLTDQGGKRRVPGLRREELASLAGMSVDYYVRLEQGRNPNVSDAVLASIATALRLDREEREYLFRLAHPPRPESGSSDRAQTRAGVWQMLNWIAAPALVLCHRLDILAWNGSAVELIADFNSLEERERNLARHYLIDKSSCHRYPDQQSIARDVVAHLRTATSRHPSDGRLSALIDELRGRSVEFAREWELHAVRINTHGTNRLRHPEYGALTLSYEVAHLSGNTDQMLLIYTATAGSPEELVLQRIAAAVRSIQARPPLSKEPPCITVMPH
ncbi:helix-turn-helix transcriptional regulator [Nocardia gipuzkoensis]